jgi:hypothetical protein
MENYNLTHSSIIPIFHIWDPLDVLSRAPVARSWRRELVLRFESGETNLLCCDSQLQQPA